MARCNEPFEMSVEYDLFNSLFGSDVLEFFEIESLIYETEKSLVYKISKKTDQSKYTLKAIRKQSDIVLNVEKLTHLKHDGMAEIITVGETEVFQYIIKPYIEGRTLRTLICENGIMGEPLVKSIASDLITVLKYLHNQKDAVIFRDLKPANIVLTPAMSPVLIDVETMRELKTKNNSDTFFVGTQGYASPEQYGYRQSDERSDIYTFGATLYYMLTGTDPVASAVSTETLKALNSSISTHMSEVIVKCMQFNPSERYSSMDELYSAIFFLESSKRSIKWNKSIIVLSLAVSLILLIASIYNQPKIDESIAPESEIQTNEEASQKSFSPSENYIKPDLPYLSEADVDLNKIPVIRSGISIARNGNDDTYRIKIDQNDMDPALIGYHYISIFQVEEKPNELDLKEMIYNAVAKGYGLVKYEETGYGSINRTKNFVILIYDENYTCLGYQYF